MWPYQAHVTLCKIVEHWQSAVQIWAIIGYIPRSHCQEDLWAAYTVLQLGGPQRQIFIFVGQIKPNNVAKLSSLNYMINNDLIKHYLD